MSPSRVSHVRLPASRGGGSGRNEAMGILGRLFGRSGEPSGMDEAGFWKIVGDVHDESPDDMDAKSEALKRALSALTAKDALAFRELFDAMMNRAYSWPLWGAAYVINGGCS